MLAEGGWGEVVQVMNRQVIFAASLLKGEMPQDIEDAFTTAQAALFPEQLSDLETSCSCPDLSNPGKHSSAGYSLIREVLDPAPFLLFKITGLRTERLLSRPQMPVESA